jgi:hypothetical protein
MSRIHSLSRRAFASGASLAALAAVPAGAACVLSSPFPTLAEVNASPDHELLVLEAQLNRVLTERYVPVARRQRREMAETNKLVDREYADLEAAGIQLDDWQRLWIRHEVLVRTERNEVVEPATGLDSDAFWDEVNGLTNDLCDQILEIEPRPSPACAFTHARFRRAHNMCGTTTNRPPPSLN